MNEKCVVAQKTAVSGCTWKAEAEESQRTEIPKELGAHDPQICWWELARHRLAFR